MQYLLLIYGDEQARAELTPAEQEVNMKAWFDYDGWLTQKGYKRAGEALQPTTTATTVREKGGKTLTVDGPFAETREQLGGFYLVECADIDEAIEAAGRMPNMGRGSVEIRPVLVLDNMGPTS
jgi:hypothetical protein